MEDDIKEITLKYESFEILKKILKKLKININELKDLLNIRIERPDLLTNEFKGFLITLLPSIKACKIFDSGYMKCLHKGSYEKPFFSINCLRQIVRTVSNCKYKLKAHNKHHGYKKGCRRNIERWFTVIVTE